jgi:mRNA interferase HigB
MKLVGRPKLVSFVRKHADVRGAIAALTLEIEQAEWTTPHDITARYPSASVIGGQDVVFNVKGNNYRVHARVAFAAGVVSIIRCGTHADYDKWTF